jgi:hypothetical protein
MLKLIYTEAGLWLEQVPDLLEAWMAQRVLLTLRLGESIQIEPGRAAFILPAQISDLFWLEQAIQQEIPEMGLTDRPWPASISMDAIDAEHIEISLEGHWLTVCPQADSGVFVADLGDLAETALFKFWQSAQPCISMLLGQEPS